MNDKNKPDVCRTIRTGALPYFIFVVAWSTFFWWLSSLISDAPPENSPIFLLGGAGPFLAALFFTHLREPKPVVRDFWLRVVDVRRLRGPWWLIALALHPLIVLVALGIDLVFGGELQSSDSMPATIPALLSMLFFVFWFGPLPEEIGWRGYAQDRLQIRMRPLYAGLILGVVWALWHVPLFFIPGTFQYDLGAGSFRFWIFLATLPPLSVLMTWVYNHTARSTLSAALIHYTGNLTGAFVEKSDRLAGFELLVLIIAAILVARSLDPPDDSAE